MQLPPIRKISKKRDILLMEKLKKSDSKMLVPLYIFQKRPLTVLEALVEYLKEKRHLKYADIARLLNRRANKIREIYINSKLKKSKIKIHFSKIFIPVSIFSNRKFSALESLAAYLHDKLKFSFHEIALMLNRDDRTIWTVYHRFRKKATQEKTRRSHVK